MSSQVHIGKGELNAMRTDKLDALLNDIDVTEPFVTTTGTLRAMYCKIKALYTMLAVTDNLVFNKLAAIEATHSKIVESIFYALLSRNIVIATAVEDARMILMWWPAPYLWHPFPP